MLSRPQAQSLGDGICSGCASTMCVPEQEMPPASTETPTKQAYWYQPFVKWLQWCLLKGFLFSPMYRKLFCSCLCYAAAHFSWLCLSPVSHLPSLV